MRQRRTYVRPVEVITPYVLVALALVAGAIAVPGFLSASNLGYMAQTAAYVGIIAIGQTLVLLLGGIDLSIPYVLNFAAVLLVGQQLARFSGPAIFAIVLAIGFGIGAVNGLFIALFDIPPIAMTLGMNTILWGVTLFFTNTIAQNFPPSFVTTLSTSYLGHVPYVAIFWAALTILVTFVLAYTTFGRSIYSAGSNRTAAVLSGVPVKRTVVLAYAISGLSAALGGTLIAGYAGVYEGMGNDYLLKSIAVVVIGGTSVLGGKGSYLQTVAGALMITVVETALLTTSPSGQDILYGVVILVMAFGFQIAVSREGVRSRLFAGARSGAGTGSGTEAGRDGGTSGRTGGGVRAPRGIRGWFEPVPRPSEAAPAPEGGPVPSPAPQAAPRQTEVVKP